MLKSLEHLKENWNDKKITGGVFSIEHNKKRDEFVCIFFLFGDHHQGHKIFLPVDAYKSMKMAETRAKEEQDAAAERKVAAEEKRAKELAAWGRSNAEIVKSIPKSSILIAKSD